MQSIFAMQIMKTIFSTHLLIHLLIQAPMNSPLRIAIIGGGAAGYFAAIEAKRNNANADITIFEK